VTQRDSGSVLDGKYEILERLATGGMGEVWRARHIHLQELRVIKILRSDRATDPHALQRFAQEARIATQIKHPNVAILYDFSRLEDGSFYMVWEHIDGEDVSTWLRGRGPFPVPLAVELGIQGLRGLDAIHSAGVIHRDLSPDNLMITRDRRGRPLVKIIDLGLAKDLDTAAGFEITQAGMFMGKLMYCSPEQAGSLKDAPLDHRSDLYSFAAVLYEMIAGRPPFDSENPHGFVLKRLTEKPIPLVGRNPQVAVPPVLGQVVLKGLEKDRDKRWPDAISFLQGLVKVSDQLRQVSTQEVPVVRPGGPRAAVPAAPAPAPTPVPPPTSSTRTGSRSGTSELSREERMELLAQIERAAKRVNEASRLQELASLALEAGRTEDAAAHVGQLEALSPRHASLPELRARLSARGVSPVRPPAAPGRKRAAPAAPAASPAPAPTAAPANAAPAPAKAAPAAAPPRPATPEPPAPKPAAPPPVAPAPTPAAAPAPPAAASEQDAHRARIAEAEKLLDKYIRERRQSLARFALETLLELVPNHPRRGDYESWVELLGEEVAQLKIAQSATEAGRQALARGDLDSARAQLAEVERSDPAHQLADAFRHELEDAEERARADAEIDRRRDRIEDMIEHRRLDEAHKELERLSASGLAKVSLENYRLRISDIAALADREAKSQDFERRYRDRVQRHDWMGARDVVLEFERSLPESPRPPALYSEISRLEEVFRRQEGVEQGVRQLETFLDQHKTAEAEMALKILVQMAPEHPQRANFEQRVRALKLGAR
jgi:eukaryotic-like serine/threonine-protein kinase